jgi:hypothetical protein
MTLNGHIENGRVVLDAAPSLPDGTRVEVTVISTGSPTKSPNDKKSSGTLYESMKSIIGIATDLPPDASTKIDDVLYGRGLP